MTFHFQYYSIWQDFISPSVKETSIQCWALKPVYCSSTSFSYIWRATLRSACLWHHPYQASSTTVYFQPPIKLWFWRMGKLQPLQQPESRFLGLSKKSLSKPNIRIHLWRHPINCVILFYNVSEKIKNSTESVTDKSGFRVTVTYEKSIISRKWTSLFQHFIGFSWRFEKA